jgi:hypothetical protein
MEQHGAGTLYEEHAMRQRLRSFRNSGAIADRSPIALAMIDPMCLNGHQLSTAHVNARQAFDLIRYSLDPIVEIFPAVNENRPRRGQADAVLQGCRGDRRFS